MRQSPCRQAFFPEGLNVRFQLAYKERVKVNQPLAALSTTVSQINLIGYCLDDSKDTETDCLTK